MRDNERMATDEPPASSASGVDAEQAVSTALRLLRGVTESRPGGEERLGQQRMAELVARAAVDRTPLIVQAGTGVGKSLAYLCGGLGARARFVVSTATRQLSDQLLQADAPAVTTAAGKARGRLVSAVVLKGRANYVCLAKVAELRALDRRDPGATLDAPESESIMELGLDLELSAAGQPRPGDGRTGRSRLRTATGAGRSGRERSAARPAATELRARNELLDWVESGPDSGERTSAPAVPDRIWQQVSTDAAGCPGARSCALGDDCFAEAARARARAADVVVVNHALLAQDLISPGPLFDDRDLVVVDEVHELESYLSSAWGHEIGVGSVDRSVNAAVRRIPRSEIEAGAIGSALQADAAALIFALGALTPGRFDERLPDVVDGPLAALLEHGTALAAALEGLAKRLADGDSDPTGAAATQAARAQLVELLAGAEAMRKVDPATVRWATRTDDAPGVLRAAPLRVGARFRNAIGERALVATSATAAVAGDFMPVARMLGLAEEVGLHTEDVGSPFDYPTQAIRYLPTHLPEPVGRDRHDHTAAVLAELTELVVAAKGRTLALFTTAAAARNAAAHLRERVTQTVLEHGELPAPVLAEEFATDRDSILCATMGMWSGLNVVGPACSLVVIDKIPFAPMDDPLASARRDRVDSEGGNGFREVYVTRAALMLTQGVGRLIRCSTDRGLVAVLDSRLRSRAYGSVLLRSLPPMWTTSDPAVARAALRRLADVDMNSPGARVGAMS